MAVGGLKYCVPCAADRRREASDAWKAKRRDARFVEPVDAVRLWQRDGGVCGVCGEGIDRTLRFPHPRSLTHDHIVPQAAGGETSYANAQAAHLSCNSRKGSAFEGVRVMPTLEPKRRGRRRIECCGECARCRRRAWERERYARRAAC